MSGPVWKFKTNSLGVKRDIQNISITKKTYKYGRKPYDLFANEIEDIYFNFPDLKRAISVAKKLASIKKDTLKRRKMHASVKVSSAYDDVNMISKSVVNLFTCRLVKLFYLTHVQKL